MSKREVRANGNRKRKLLGRRCEQCRLGAKSGGVDSSVLLKKRKKTTVDYIGAEARSMDGENQEKDKEERESAQKKPDESSGDNMGTTE